MQAFLPTAYPAGALLILHHAAQRDAGVLQLRTKLNISSAEPAHGRRRLQKECKAVAKCSAHPTTGQACIKCNTTVGAPTYDCVECCPGCKPTTSGALPCTAFPHLILHTAGLT